MTDIWDRLLNFLPAEAKEEALRRTPPRNAGGEGPVNRFVNNHGPNVREENRQQTLRVCRYQAQHGATPEIRANARIKLGKLDK